MKLLFVWIKEDENKVFKNCGVNFSTEYEIYYHQGDYELKIEKRGTSLPANFYALGDESQSCISQVTCIVGKNGSGKTSLLKYIYNIDLLPIKDEETIRKCQHWNTVQVYEKGGILKIYHNQEFDIKVNAKDIHHEIYVMNSEKNDKEEVLENGNYASISKFFFSNDYWVSINSNFVQSGSQSKLAITPYDIHIAQSTFFDKICKLQHGIFHISDAFYRYNTYIKKKANKSHLQNLLYLLLYATATQSKADAIINLLSRTCVIFHSLNQSDQFIDIYRHFLLCKHAFDPKEILKATPQNAPNLLQKLSEKVDINSIRQLDIDCLKACILYDHIMNPQQHETTDKIAERRCNLYDYLIVELLLCLNEFENVLSIKDLDIDSLIGRLESQIKQSASIDKYEPEKNELLQKEVDYFRHAKSSIDKLQELLHRYGKSDTNNLSLKYCESKEFVDDFLEYIVGELKSERSFPLKYIWLNYRFSSGEFAYLNMFSGLNAVPYWNYFSGDAIKGFGSTILLLLDEPDAFCHPEWQRRLLKEITSTCNKLYKGKSIQIILSTHSPMFLSDIPNECVIRLEEQESNVNCVMHQKHIFGANIFDLYHDGFFLTRFMGEFAYDKISAAIRVIYQKYENCNGVSEQDYISAKAIVDLIGEPFLRNKIMSLINEIEAKIQ